MLRVAILESRATDTIQQQIMATIPETLKKLMDNENRSSFNLITEMQLLESCQKETHLLLRKRFLFNVLELARQELMIEWKKYTGEVLASVQTYNVDSRYCGILQPVRVLPGFVDRLIQVRAACEVCTKRLLTVLRHDGPVKNKLRNLHEEINAAMPAEASTIAKSQDLEEGGLGVLLLVTKKLQGKLEEIAEREPKYRDLIRMENFNFLSMSLKSRHMALLEPFQKECESQYLKVGMKSGCDGRQEIVIV